MGSPQPTLDPRTNSNDWMFILLNGVRSGGTIPRGGVRGFKRQTGWDKKRGKGTKGATLTLTTAPPCDGEIAFQLNAGFNADGTPSTDFADHDAFVRDALSIDPAKQQAQGLAVWYPGFASIGLTTVVVEDYTVPQHQGKGLYIVTIKICEWQKPPPVSIVSTVAKAKPDTTQTVKFQQPPDIQQRLDQIALLQNANKPFNGGP